MGERIGLVKLQGRILRTYFHVLVSVGLHCEQILKSGIDHRTQRAGALEAIYGDPDLWKK